MFWSQSLNVIRPLRTSVTYSVNPGSVPSGISGANRSARPVARSICAHAFFMSDSPAFIWACMSSQ